MILKTYKLDGSNTGRLKLQDGKKITKEGDRIHITPAEFDLIDIKKGRWLDFEETSHPMKFKELKCFENKNVYFLHLFGQDDNTRSGKYISLNFWQNQRFLWLQNAHWVQQKDNVMWFVNIAVAILAIAVALK